MIEIGHIAQIWRYPIKSMAGEAVSEALLGATGLALDRIWAVRDEMAGEIRGAKNFPRLMLLRAACQANQVDIYFPDGSRVDCSHEEAEELVSDFIEHPITLWPLQESNNTEFYRKNKSLNRTDLEQIFALDDNEALPDFSVFPADKLTQLGKFTCPPGSYTDAYPIHILTTSALADLRKRLPDAQIEVERFRPNILIDDTHSAGLTLTDWPGRKIQLGDTLLRCEIPTLRCAMTSHVQLDLQQDRRITRTIAKDFNRLFGVYCRVEKSGNIAVNDKISIAAS